jgi:hypothetical protein
VSRIEIPHGCVPTRSLYALARTMERLAAWHKAHGGQAKDEPCLREIVLDTDGHLIARVTAGNVSWMLRYMSGEWREAIRSEADPDPRNN